jgi:uncharacterized membrane protein HdeD (DUF308 family)
MILVGFIPDDGTSLISVTIALIFIFSGLLIGMYLLKFGKKSSLIIILASLSTLIAPSIVKVIKSLL